MSAAVNNFPSCQLSHDIVDCVSKHNDDKWRTLSQPPIVAGRKNQIAQTMFLTRIKMPNGPNGLFTAVQKYRPTFLLLQYSENQNSHKSFTA